MTTHRPDFYKTLQVDPEADPDVIGAAYRKLAQRYHPDVTDDPTARARMAAINAAWEILRDPAKRAAYDRDRRLGISSDYDASAGWEPQQRSPARHAPTSSGASWPSGSSSGSSSAGSSYPRSAPSGRPPAGSTSATGQGERWRAGSAAGTGETQDVWAGPPPGPPSGSVLTFGRYREWSLGEIARRDPGYLEWLERASVGRYYQREIGDILRRLGRR
jgi:curved DNA-binding protein CbpA